MKKILTMALALLTLLALAAPACADVIWEPMDNSFYTKHREQCEYVGRRYYANGQEGFVTLWEAPGGSMVQSQFQNGEKLFIYYIYNNEQGFAAYWVDGKEVSGWIPLADLELVYDHLSFEEEYADRITDYNGEFADYEGDAEEINFYEYPGAAGIKQTWETGGQWHVLENLTGTPESRSYISSVFVDEDGRTWGYVSYMYGRLNAWFCLDEPDGREFPLRDVPAPNLTPAQTPRLPAAGYVPYVLVAAVVAVTSGLLAVFYGKKRRKTTD